MARQLGFWKQTLTACVAMCIVVPVATAQFGIDLGEVDTVISDDGGPEIIRERYPNRATKIERHVKQDSGGNYINHGPWKMWDEAGTLIAEGQFEEGDRHGLWTRWYRRGEAELFARPPYKDYSGPFISQAVFDHGKLDGEWIVYDAKQRKISEIQFAEGLRHGIAVWWFPNGQKMQEIDYVEGKIDGKFLQWTADASLSRNDLFEEGRRLASKISHHEETADRRNRSRTQRTAAAKKTEGMYLFAKEVVETPDDWWDAKLAIYAREGDDERHGEWAEWYSNGQLLTKGEYDHDVEVGTFTWWYSNGQKSVEGNFKKGKPDGEWVWWHQNGQKKVSGKYVGGHPNGPWSWWHEDGKVAEAADFGDAVSDVVEAPPQFPDEIAQPKPVPEPVLARPPRRLRR